MPREPRELPERAETLRNAIRETLRTGPFTIRELSITLGASERDLLPHLEHLERSLRNTPERLTLEPARCLACGFTYKDRTRHSKPGRCPTCKSTRIARPRFQIVLA